ncbi:flagellar protein FlaG [Thalassotalea ganghwensis]
MVKPVTAENPLASQFSEIATNSFKPVQDDDKKASLKNGNRPNEALSPMKVAETDNTALKKAQDVEAKKIEQEVEKLEEAYAEISEFMSLYNRNVNFSTDEQSEKTVIKVFDSDSQELIKQFPSEDLIELAQKIKQLRQDVDLKSGIFLDEKV